MAYVIEKGVPLPRKPPLASALRAMVVGDCILVADRSRKNVASQATMIGKLANDGRRYATKEEGAGTRVWRVA